MSWVPAACALPTLEQPLRVAEFDDLFATSLISVEHDHRQARLTLRDDGGLADRVRDLTARETACCSFFQFRVESGRPGTVRLLIEVPSAHEAVLVGLVRRAREALAGAA